MNGSAVVDKALKEPLGSMTDVLGWEAIMLGVRNNFEGLNNLTESNAFGSSNRATVFGGRLFDIVVGKYDFSWEKIMINVGFLFDGSCFITRRDDRASRYIKRTYTNFGMPRVSFM